MTLPRYLLLLLCLMLPASAVSDTFQEPEQFISEVFAGNTPEPKVIWITNELRPSIEEIMAHDFGALRVRYWGEPGRTAWILEEIGKEQPITTGIVVNQGKVELIRVLIFRESRGWEVKYPFFTDQFKGAGLKDGQELDRSIDGVSGATLSTRALTKLSRLALYLHQHSEFANGSP